MAICTELVGNTLKTVEILKHVLHALKKLDFEVRIDVLIYSTIYLQVYSILFDSILGKNVY